MKKSILLLAIGAMSLSEVNVSAQDAFPEEGAWYRLLNRETAGNRENSYLGYYPETPWYIYNKSTGSRAEMITSDLIAAGNMTTSTSTEAELDGQLWQFVAGTGENEGKYALVCKAWPDGAISNAIVNNDGQPVTTLNGNNATNASRWLYVADRTAAPADVCWFDWSESEQASGTTYYQPTFANSVNPEGIHFALAAAGQKNQVIRMDTNNAFEPSTWWTPVKYEEPGEEVVFPSVNHWYTLLNRETAGNRENTYLGYYPETPWYIYNKTDGSRAEKITSDFIASGNPATEAGGASVAEIDGQWWRFVAGTGENEGKYALVCKAWPDGAISNVIVNNEGQPVTSLSGNNATNASRWLYVADREAEPDKVCWFDWSETTTAGAQVYYRPTFVNPIDEAGKYFAQAAAGQKNQVIRMSTAGEASTWWMPTAVAEIGEPEPPVEPGLTIDTTKSYRLSPIGNPHVGDDVCLGWYPESVGTQWPVYSSVTGNIAEGYNQFICVGAIADEATASPLQYNQQLWRFVAGEGENEGKYAIINTEWPHGAISNVPYDNNGAVVAPAQATNASRWKYINDRDAAASDVCWFTLEDLQEANGGYSAFITIEALAPGYKYMQVAGPGQSRQVMRWNETASAEKWSILPVATATPVSIDQIAADKNADGNSAVYDMLGRRVSAPVRGLYIINGRKVMVK